MQSVKLANKELIGIVETFINKLLLIERSKFPFHKADIEADYACGEQYLLSMQSKKVDGFPEKTFGIDLMKWIPPTMSQTLTTLDHDLLAWSGCRNNAVKMFYPKGGYMGWHHNANAPGYNILLSWSKEGKGYFRYQDPVTKEIVTMPDTPGWTCKVGYYGPWHEKDKIYWHCANAKEEERFTLGYIIPHQGMWENMIEDIETA